MLGGPPVLRQSLSLKGSPNSVWTWRRCSWTVWCCIHQRSITLWIIRYYAKDIWSKHTYIWHTQDLRSPVGLPQSNLWHTRWLLEENAYIIYEDLNDIHLLYTLIQQWDITITARLPWGWWPWENLELEILDTMPLLQESWDWDLERPTWMVWD